MNDTAETSPISTPQLGGMLNRFGTDLMETGLKTPGKNALLSPTSIAILLAMLQVGARGKSRKAIEETLGAGPISDLQAATSDFLAHLRSVSGSDDLELLSANGMWGQAGYAFNPDYVQIVQDTYEGEIEEFDFINDSEGALTAINDWVSEKTRGMIPAIMESLDPLTRLVLGNAIYFKARWAEPFDKDLTNEKPFYLADGGEVTVETMHKTDAFLYRKSDYGEVVALPYKGGKVSFVIFLPAPGLLLDDISPPIKTEHMDNAINQASIREISLALPRLSLEWGVELQAPLTAMGLGALFGQDADLSGITPKPGVLINEILHKAAMDLDEEGTEAAAVTMAFLAEGAPPDDALPPLILWVDRPFLFAIRDNVSGANLFLGQVHDPTAH